MAILKHIPIFKDLGFIKNPSLFIDSNRQRGTFYRLNLPFNNIFVITDPEILQHVLVNKESNYLKSKIYWGQLKAIVGNALGTTEGEEWLWMKRLQMPFFTHEKAKGYLPEVLKINDFYFNRWKQNFNNKNGKDLIHCFSEMNLAAILKVIFGIDRIENCADIASYIADGEASIAYRSKFPWRPYSAWLSGHNQRAAGYLDFFNNLTQEQIKLKRNNTEVVDMLDELIKQSEFNNGKLSLQDIRNELIIHLGASTETAAVAEGWTLYLLQQHPKYLTAVCKEISEVSNGHPISTEDYPKLIKTKQAIQESMRLYPPSHAIIRDAQEQDEINGIKIPKGSTMFVSAYGLHRNPEIWNAPEQFLPERFEKENEFTKYSYIPFGAGRHTCIGRFLGLPQVVLSIATFLQRFEYQIFNKDIFPLSLSTLKPNEALQFSASAKQSFV